MLFDAELRGCKLVGSHFTGCTLRPLLALGGNWSFVSLRGADLRGARLDGCDVDGVDWRGVRIDLATAVLLARSRGAVVDG